nr:hypothetical protein [Desulfuromonadales bacterium]NIS43169.1 hypothetical protein [Desulfuromonadales bacterium]
MTTLLGLMFLPGCTAALVMHAEQEESRENRVAEPVTAWRDGQGRLTVCARGWP